MSTFLVIPHNKANRRNKTKKMVALFLYLCFFTTSTQAQTKSPYLSYDWAFFELKGRVRAVTIVFNNKSEFAQTHIFNRNGELQDEEAEILDDYNPFGYYRDDRGRIIRTGNGHSMWTWNGKTLDSKHWEHMGESTTYFYIYNQEGKRTGYEDEKGKIHKYAYITHDIRGNWTYRIIQDQDGSYSEKRKIVYY